MKNQYFGDINDYRKYGLLRVLARCDGIRVGVCWLLTPPDGGGDGQLRSYLTQPARWRHYDPELFDALGHAFNQPSLREVASARLWKLIPKAVFFEAVLEDNALSRQRYFAAAWKHLHQCELLFLDPDNGIEVASPKWGRRNSSKYVYWRELADAYRCGHSLLVYQHFPRVVRERFLPFLAARIAEELGAGRVRAFSTSHVAFFLVEREEHMHLLEDVPAQVAAAWPRQITPWQPAVRHLHDPSGAA